MIIPNRFFLAGIPVEVVTDNKLVETKQCIGEARYSKQQIIIDQVSAPPQITEQSFLHELVHWIFYILGEDDLRNNEKLVDQMAHLLYQYETTKEFHGASTPEDNTTYKRQSDSQSLRP